MIRLATMAVFALSGLALAAAGAWPSFRSWEYAIAGIVLVACAMLIRARHLATPWLFAAFMLGTLAWAVWEVGLDWWQLAPRGGLIILIGLWLLIPSARVAVKTSHDQQRVVPVRPVPRAMPVAVALLVCAAVAVYAMFQNAHDLSGQLPQQTVSADPAIRSDFYADEWHQYGRANYGQGSSPLTQITSEDVDAPDLAWTYRTADVKLLQNLTETGHQVMPLKIGNRLHVFTPHNITIAIHAATAQEQWPHDVNSGLNPDRQHQTCRGVAHLQDAAAGTDGDLCARHVYMPTADARLIALGAKPGERCTYFGDDGGLVLKAGMPGGYYYSTMPHSAVEGLIIIGGAFNDNAPVCSLSAVIRSSDIDTGELVWDWDPATPPLTAPIEIAGGESDTANPLNSWSVFFAAEAFGLFYIPLGNQLPDELGSGRSSIVEEHSSLVVAPNIKTGSREWVLQTVRHDLSDMDLPAQPMLVDPPRPDGSQVPAPVQPATQGDIHALDRRTVLPHWKVTEVPSSNGVIPDDFTALTQPVSALSFTPDPLTGADMWGATMFDPLACRTPLHRVNYEGRHTPPLIKGTIGYPGNFGVFNWGAVAEDPAQQVMVDMRTHLPFTLRLLRRAQISGRTQGEPASGQGLNGNEGAPDGVVTGPLQGRCSALPRGYITGMDLRSGEIAWQHNTGTVCHATPLPVPFEQRVPGLSGPINTAGGVAFVDDTLRGHDRTKGQGIWRARLPAGGDLTPMTHERNGRQYLAMVEGGHRSIGTKPGETTSWPMPSRKDHRQQNEGVFMRNPVIWIAILIILGAALLTMIASSRPDAGGPETGPVPPHALVDD